MSKGLDRETNSWHLITTWSDLVFRVTNGKVYEWTSTTIQFFIIISI